MSKQKKNPKLNLKTILGSILAVLIALVGGYLGLGGDEAGTPAAGGNVPAYVQEVADYIFEHGELPDRFITK